MLRAVRLAAKLGFRMDDEAWACIAQLAPLIQEAAPARLFDEILKLFLGGHAYESFRWLEASGLLDELLPGMRQFKAGASHEVPSPLLEAALKSTDLRVTEGKPVTPSFLLAALFWHMAYERFQAELASGADAQLAWSRASDAVIRVQSERIAMPRRFTQAMEEIWVLQFRLLQTQRKKSRRLLSHPRFRAAYDFLCLRGLEDAQAKDAASWWERAQQSISQEPDRPGSPAAPGSRSVERDHLGDE